jgi:hypothetical protein
MTGIQAEQPMSHEPIESKYIEEMNEIAQMLDAALDGAGFCLLVFERNTSEGRMNYISNSNRSDMLVALKEFIAKCEGRVMPQASDRGDARGKPQ